MNIASASKFLYASYVVEVRAGSLSAADIEHLTFVSGYTNFSQCSSAATTPPETVASCAASGTNGTVAPANVGKFFYDGGHMQAHASMFTTLGPATNPVLAAELNRVLALGATAADFSFTQPQLAGGVKTTPDVYATFLRRIVGRTLKMNDVLSSYGVCTSAAACPDKAVQSPFPENEVPQYGLGHWIEDRTVSDGAFSSPGLFGFYPWIDADKQFYRMVARATSVGITSKDPQVQPYTLSMYCGRAIRKAWVTGISR